jgi:hypothetical protein
MPIPPRNPAEPYEWLKRMGDRTSSTLGFAVAVDASGNVLVAGGTSGTAAGGSSLGGEDALLVEYSPTGELAWIRQFGTDRGDRALAISMASGGDVLVGGWTADGERSFVARFDSTGEQRWFHELAIRGGVHGLAVDPGGFATATAGNSVVRIDPRGTETWTVPFAAGDGWGEAVAIDRAGNAVVVGALRAMSSGTETSRKLLVVSFGPDGQARWRVTLGGESLGGRAELAAGKAIAVVDDEVVIAGENGAFLDGRPADRSFLVKLDRSGTVRWTSMLPGQQLRARALAVDAKGNLFVAGLTTGAIEGQANRGASDLFVEVLQAGGGYSMGIQYGTAGADLARGVTAGATGVFVVGGLDGTVKAPHVEDADLVAADYDLVLLKL